MLDDFVNTTYLNFLFNFLGWLFSMTCHTIVKSWVPPGSSQGHKNFINSYGANILVGVRII